ncbi:hypothetical protein AYI69_g4408 [Smittium culicis]|nr:hypothetical protein AYI69_g4408 [Smittium culicis]
MVTGEVISFDEINESFPGYTYEFSDYDNYKAVTEITGNISENESGRNEEILNTGTGFIKPSFGQKYNILAIFNSVFFIKQRRTKEFDSIELDFEQSGKKKNLDKSNTYPSKLETVPEGSRYNPFRPNILFIDNRRFDQLCRVYNNVRDNFDTKNEILDVGKYVGINNDTLSTQKYPSKLYY